MSQNSKIEWTDHTFNPWIGCTKVGPGCDNCYAENLMDKRMHKVEWGARGVRVRTSINNWHEPIRWNARHQRFFSEHGRRQRVFCASLADVFDNAAPDEWRDDLWRLIEQTPNLDWLLLTKRIGNVGNMLPIPFDFEHVYPHVWLGATIVNQAEADRDIPKLLATPARARFLSMEPLLGPVTLRNLPIGNHHEALGFHPYHDRFDALMGKNRVDWVIVGGESGHNARPMQSEWAQSLRDQCAAAGVAFLFKQWGEWLGAGQDGDSDHAPLELNASDEPVRVGKKAAGRLLDGAQHDGFPVGRR